MVEPINIEVKDSLDIINIEIANPFDIVVAVSVLGGGGDGLIFEIIDNHILNLKGKVNIIDGHILSL